MNSSPVRVLIVDDSAFARSVLARQLAADPEIEVIGQAGDGIEALEQIKALRPDVVTMDISMPRMDGLQALDALMRDCPTPTVMVSALTHDGAQITIDALERGAVDFVLKPMRAGVPLPQDIEADLCVKVKNAARARLGSHRGLKPPVRDNSVRRTWKHRVVVIGSSTGGPQALCEVLPRLPADLQVPVLVVQHMPPGFTASLAERLNGLCKVPVREAQEGDDLEPGVVLLAPGGRHMCVTPSGQIRLDDGPPECSVRPSVNVTMESLVASFGRACVGVILTGMGSDGTRGAGLIKAGGGDVITQSAETCVVYGMPRSAFEAGFSDAVVPLSKVADEIVNRCVFPSSSARGRVKVAAHD